MSSTIIEYAGKAYRDEVYSEIVYSRLARIFHGKPIARKLKAIAEMEARHASFWREFLRRRGVDVGAIRVSKLRIWLFSLLARLLGLGITIKILEMSEEDAIETYSRILGDKSIDESERKEILGILEDELVHEHEFAEEEERYKDFISHVRDVVLGMSDGLVEILSVSTGLAGAYGNPFAVALGGSIVGVAGALSMGIGSFTSVRAQKQVRTSIFSRLALAAKYVPHVFAKRLRELLRRKGFSDKISDVMTSEALADTELLSKIIAEEEYGVSEAGLENPVRSGLYTGLSYILGAFIPLIPYFMGFPVIIAIPLSLVFASIMLAMTGFFIAVTANLSIRSKVFELVVAGLGSALLTYIIGRIASIILGIEVE